MIQLSNLIDASIQTNQIEDIPLTAVIDTALCVGAGGSSGSQADKPLLKTANGRLVIPASQLKGRLRHECEKLTRALHFPTCESPVAQTMCPQIGLTDSAFSRDAYDVGKSFADGRKQHHCLICQMFGNPALPARIQFSDLVCVEPPENTPEVLRPGVTINRRRRTAEEKKLYFLETSPANAQLRFTGSITLEPGSPNFTKLLLIAGLKHIHALGGSKSTGLGWLHWDSPLFNHPIEQTAWDSLQQPASDAAPSATEEAS
ncbi:RAMP superfamily CRISPR-associated protein [Oscillatoria sp. CS-180]|uniref:RAMP superfamily CRISPR-associated protein n=1 Tax=Oscillatoria sp. CS-180 TaxID=3021720 RepID=UPI00232F2D47|nr:RAMP superfamily CRISPR-associated protein [Oscillatoria sp. CS-180]MDB9526789.1 RAMP superfamily CRISPR-associated protein [Oscillatoria sp. CS-180]